MGNYEASRIANYGRDVSKAYASFLKTQERLLEHIQEALDNNISPTKIAHDMMGRCPSRQMQIDLLSVIHALVKLEKLPESVLEPFNDGIMPRRV